jgi:hypothetical protein
MIVFNGPVRPAREITGQELEDLIESLGGTKQFGMAFFGMENAATSSTAAGPNSRQSTLTIMLPWRRMTP